MLQLLLHPLPSLPPLMLKLWPLCPSQSFMQGLAFVVYLCHTLLAMPLREVAQSKAPALIVAYNEALSPKAQHANIWVFTAKWSPVL